MGRRRTIDREMVLDVAEKLIQAEGVAALTLQSVADAAGITKGGMQSTFGTKEALMSAMLGRWMNSYSRKFAPLIASGDTPRARVSAHAKVTLEDDKLVQEKGATLLAALLHVPEHLAITRAWYADWIDRLTDDEADRRKHMLAFLAIEGAYLLRYLGLVDYTPEQWKTVSEDIAALIEH